MAHRTPSAKIYAIKGTISINAVFEKIVHKCLKAVQDQITCNVLGKHRSIRYIFAGCITKWSNLDEVGEPNLTTYFFITYSRYL